MHLRACVVSASNLSQENRTLVFAGPPEAAATAGSFEAAAAAGLQVL